MVTYQARNGEVKVVTGDPVIIVSVVDGVLHVRSFRDGEMDSAFRPAKDVDEVAEFISKVLDDKD